MIQFFKTQGERLAKSRRILGIDPGTRVLGYGLLVQGAGSFSLSGLKIAEAGVLRASPKLDALNRLGEIHEAVVGLLAELKPDVCVLEKAFFGINAQSALKLGEARGVLIAALARSQCSIVELTPTVVKKTICGHGHAPKELVCASIEKLLKFNRGKLPYDVTDALALALTYGLSPLPLLGVAKVPAPELRC